MKDVVVSEDLARRIQTLYEEMEASYNRVASELNFTCDGCEDNCCDSYFQHHTYLEWAYLWLGFRQLPQERQAALLEKAESYTRECRKALDRGERPQVMCPLCEEGRCVLYTHRLMVCRTHGVPASMTRPDGKSMHFPGCFRCQAIVEERQSTLCVERTPLLKEMVLLENELMQGKRNLYPKIRLTIAQMLQQGPPRVADLPGE